VAAEGAPVHRLRAGAAPEAAMTATTMRGEGRKTLALRQVILEELAAYDGAMSSRQVFYRCVSRGAVQNNKAGTRAVLRMVLNMRRDGSIPYSRIVDRTRRKHHTEGWDGLQEVIESAGNVYRRDLWADQDTVVMIACEKAALEGIFSTIVDEYGASLWTLRGFGSESFEYEWAEEIKELNRNGQSVAITYFGDFDPSGLMIEETTRRKLEEFRADFEWERGGLLASDFEDFDLVRIPVKRTDSRAKGFLSQFGDSGAELDALSPAELEERIQAAITKHINMKTWLAGRRTEALERQSLDLVVKHWGVAVRAAEAAA
jgi:hypothetical protein